eukprot:TRINITY_DN21077_c0_g1_i4.p1 TRINITY_DN21077_c0_g1~~TRINITY_DN21077_c0_g1_i4.p1  ORF type:complete len:505 (-),score=64.69 TRINITY_DN21077_c0_g1_i4:66-1580(-)
MGEKTEQEEKMGCIVRQFNLLSSAERKLTLGEILNSCTSEEISYIDQKLPDFLYRDFISELPLELAERILERLPVADLLQACTVSRSWNDIISGMKMVWRAQCLKFGCLSSGIDPNFPKQSCIKGMKIQHDLHEGSAWKQDAIVNLVKSPGRFSALHHDREHVAGGTSDSIHTHDNETSSESVVIWSVINSSVVLSFPVSGSISCIKLSYPSLVVCGHFDGTLSSHQVSGNPETNTSPGDLINKFRLHTAPVLSLDFDESEDLLISGSADWTVKVWQLSTATQLSTLSSHSHWVLSVIFTPSHKHSIKTLSGKDVLVMMTRDDIQMFSWNPVQSDQGASLKGLTLSDIHIPLKSVTDAVQSFFFTPGLHFDGKNISFIRQMPMFDSHTIGDADIVTIDAESAQLVQSVHINQKIRKLLAIGKRFAIILLPYVDTKFKNLVVVDLKLEKIVGGCTVPHSRATTPDFSQVCIGRQDWLDGFSDDSTSGLVCCLGLQDSSLHTVIWT